MPAKDIIFFESEITIFSEFNLYSIPSKALNDSFCLAYLMLISPEILSAS